MHPIEAAAKALLSVDFDTEYERVQNWAQRLKRDEARASILAFLDGLRPEDVERVARVICYEHDGLKQRNLEEARAAIAALRAIAEETP